MGLLQKFQRNVCAFKIGRFERITRPMIQSFIMLCTSGKFVLIYWWTWTQAEYDVQFSLVPVASWLICWRMSYFVLKLRACGWAWKRRSGPMHAPILERVTNTFMLCRFHCITARTMAKSSAVKNRPFFQSYGSKVGRVWN